MSDKETAQETAFDAIASKQAALAKGYFEDAWLPRVGRAHAPRKDPMINRGTWFRVSLFQTVIQRFLDTNAKCQVLVLGGGLDTLYWRLRFQSPETQTFLELDLPETVQLKAQKLGLARRQNHEPPEWTWGQNFRAREADLEGLDVGSLELDQETPTLIISDVVLSYLESDWTVELIRNVL